MSSSYMFGGALKAPGGVDSAFVDVMLCYSQNWSQAMLFGIKPPVPQVRSRSARSAGARLAIASASGEADSSSRRNESRGTLRYAFESGVRTNPDGKRCRHRSTAGHGQDEQRRLWTAIASGIASEDAAVDAGVPLAVRTGWFRKAGGMPPAMFGLSAKPLSCRYPLFLERKEIALLRALECTMQEVAHRLRRQRRRSPASRGATPLPESVASNIPRRQRNGTLSDLPGARSRCKDPEGARARQGLQLSRDHDQPAPGRDSRSCRATGKGISSLVLLIP